MVGGTIARNKNMLPWASRGQRPTPCPPAASPAPRTPARIRGSGRPAPPQTPAAPARTPARPCAPSRAPASRCGRATRRAPGTARPGRRRARGTTPRAGPGSGSTGTCAGVLEAASMFSRLAGGGKSAASKHEAAVLIWVSNVQQSCGPTPIIKSAALAHLYSLTFICLTRNSAMMSICFTYCSCSTRHTSSVTRG